MSGMNQTTSGKTPRATRTQSSSGGQRILDAAEELFSRLGYNAVSVQQIATRAGVSKANVFHHFAGKQELYLAVLERACERTCAVLHELQQDACAHVPALREFSAAHLRHILEHPDVSRLILREVLDGDPRQGQLMAARVFGEQFSRLVELVRGGQDEHVLRNDMHAADAAACIVGLNVFLFQAWPVLKHLPESSFHDPRRSGAQWLHLLLHGIVNPRHKEERE